MITLSQCHFRDLLKLSPQERKVYKEITAEEYDDFRVKEGMGLNDKELELLDALNDAFTKSGMPYGIGFRVAQQMGRYLENIPEEAGISRGEGLDAQLVQRVFTKLRGSADQLSALLLSRIKIRRRGCCRLSLYASRRSRIFRDLRPC